MVEVHKVSGAAFDGNVYLVLDEKPILVDAGMMAGPTLKNIKKFIDPARSSLSSSLTAITITPVPLPPLRRRQEHA